MGKRVENDEVIVDVRARMKYRTDKAVLLQVGGSDGPEIWFPRRQVRQNDDGTWSMSEDVATKKGVADYVEL